MNYNTTIGETAYKERTKKMAGILDTLGDSIVQSPEKLDEFIKMWNGGFHRYSFNNTILIMFQRPDAKLLAGYQQWIKDHDRQVMRGQRAIWILAPQLRRIHKKTEENDEDNFILTGYRPVKVFDIKQTGYMVDVNYGIAGIHIRFLWDDPEKTIGIETGCDSYVSGKADFELFKMAVRHKVVMENCGHANGKTDGKTHFITPKSNEASMSATLWHEEAHSLLGHCIEGWFETDELSADEIEAEAVSYVVSSYMGIENERAKYYIGNWSRFGSDLQGKGKKILTVAERMIRDIERVAEKQSASQ